MEGLYMDLERCLKVYDVPLALPIKLAILLDVAYALLYLHTQNPPIIHRDLTAGNVLLTNDLRAKLADLGASKILDLHPRSQAAQTICPGTLGAMPPEALTEQPNYNIKLDDFSFGTLILHVVNQEFPIFYDVDQYESGKKHIAMRRKAIGQMGKTHVLYPIVIRCLQDDPQKRPTTTDIRASLEQLTREHPKQFKDVVEVYGAMEGMRKGLNELERLQSEMNTLQSSLTEREGEIEQLQGEVTALTAHLGEKESEVGQLKKEKGDLQKETDSQKTNVKSLTTTLEAKEREIEVLQTESGEFWKGVELHKKKMSELQPVMSKLSATVSEWEGELQSLRRENGELQDQAAATNCRVQQLEMEKRQLETDIETQKESVTQLQRNAAMLTTTLTEQEREIEQLKREKGRSQEGIKLQKSDAQLLPDVTKLGEVLDELDSSLHELIRDIPVKVPDHQTQKQEIEVLLQQRLKKGDIWYLVDVRWMKQWKKYVGYDSWDQSDAGLDSANPGPIDNSNLLKGITRTALKDHLMEELDYSLLPEPAWIKMLAWFGLSEKSQPIARKVVEHGLYMKHCKVEVYLLEFKLSMHGSTEVITRHISCASTVADLEAELRSVFSVLQETECRVWHRYMTNTYELLTTPTQTLKDAGLYNGQTIVLEKKNQDGSWPRMTERSAYGKKKR